MPVLTQLRSSAAHATSNLSVWDPAPAPRQTHSRAQDFRLVPTPNPKTQAAYEDSASARRVAFGNEGRSNEQAILNSELEWDPGNREGIDAFIRQYGRGGPKFSESRPPLAVFDFDGTVIGAKRKSGELGDSGDALFLYMLSHGLFKAPTSWRDTSKWLTPEAEKILEADFPTGPGGGDLPTHKNKAGAEAILAIYNGNLPNSDKSAWTKSADTMLPDKAPNTMRPDYAWSMQLMAGYKPEELREIIERAIDVALSEENSTLPIGTQSVNVRMTPHLQMIDLMQRLRDHGIRVVISSATYGPMVEAVAKRMGIPFDDIIGSQPALDENGRITHGFKACGTFPDNNQDIMNVGAGKRCGLNEFNGVTDPMQQLHGPPEVAFGAGDSKGDWEGILMYANEKLWLNRKGEFSNPADAQFGGPWWVNRPFVGP